MMNNASAGDNVPQGMFGPGPAREPHISVRERWAHCENLPEDHPDKLKEFLNRQLNEELNVLENAARNLTDFPDADWEIRKWLARQCSDEARHALAYQALLRARGGEFGDFPVMNFQFKLLGTIPTLEGRLAVQNRTFEADGLDAAVYGATEARSLGDHQLAELYETQAADEIVHVRFANEWIKSAVKRQPRIVLDIASALTIGARGFEWVFADGGTDVTKYPVAEEERLHAGFDASEVQVSADLSRNRREAILKRRRS
jgi:uncharacterized ferritin-like protein (DUF455 family)